MSSKFEIGDKVYYKGFFGLKLVEILKIEEDSYFDGWSVHRFNKYLIKFTSGKLKIVERDKLF